MDYSKRRLHETKVINEKRFRNDNDQLTPVKKGIKEDKVVLNSIQKERITSGNDFHNELDNCPKSTIS